MSPHQPWLLPKMAVKEPDVLEQLLPDVYGGFLGLQPQCLDVKAVIPPALWEIPTSLWSAWLAWTSTPPGAKPCCLVCVPGHVKRDSSKPTPHPTVYTVGTYNIELPKNTDGPRLWFYPKGSSGDEVKAALK